MCQCEMGGSADHQTRGLAIGLISYGPTFSECYLELVIRISWDNCIQFWFSAWWLLIAKLGFVGFLYQLNTRTYLTDQCTRQYEIILTLCCNEQALLTLDIIVIFTVKLNFFWTGSFLQFILKNRFFYWMLNNGVNISINNLPALDSIVR